MGLDMWVSAKPVDGDEYELQYWRKHNRLHGWMTSLAIEKGLVDNDCDFNCVPMELTESDIRRLERDIEDAENLPVTQGFFFGGSYDYDEDYRKEDRAFIKNALAALADRETLRYNSWW